MEHLLKSQNDVGGGGLSKSKIGERASYPGFHFLFWSLKTENDKKQAKPGIKVKKKPVPQSFLCRGPETHRADTSPVHPLVGG